MRKLKTILFAISPLFISSSFGSDGSSGCGPGWYVFKDNSLVSSSLRTTTNGFLFPSYTIGMTMGTSNCSQHKIVRNEKRSLHFATMAYHEIKADIARGHGEYLSALNDSIGCPADTRAHLGRVLQKNYTQVAPRGTPAPENLLLQVYKSIVGDKMLAQRCILDMA